MTSPWERSLGARIQELDPGLRSYFAAGYSFLYPDLEPALAQIVGERRVSPH